MTVPARPRAARLLRGVPVWRWFLAAELSWYAAVLAVIVTRRVSSPRAWTVEFELMIGVAVVCAAVAVARYRVPHRVGEMCLAVLAVDIAIVALQPLGALGPSRVMLTAAVVPILLAVVARRCRWWTLAAAVLAAGAGIGLDVRRGGNTLSYDLARWLVDNSPTRQFVLVTGILLVVAPVASGLVLRSTDAARHAEALARVQAEERLQVAREVHDTVANHITGIVVHAQAAGLPAGVPPATARSLDAIETSAQRALTAMRRMVTTLRLGEHGATPGAARPDPETTAGGTASAPAAVRAGLDELGVRTRHPRPAPPTGPATGPATGHDDVDLTIGSGADLTIPPDLFETLRGVVIEAVTNARRHMPAHGRVRVDLSSPRPSVLTVQVTNAVTTGPARVRGGGYGLVGLRERISAANGHLDAGPTPDHHWRLHVELPVPVTDRPG